LHSDHAFLTHSKYKEIYIGNNTYTIKLYSKECIIYLTCTDLLSLTCNGLAKVRHLEVVPITEHSFAGSCLDECQSQFEDLH